MTAFETIRLAMLQLCEDAIYSETESAKPCPDYLAELRAASLAIGDCTSFEGLAAVGWIDRKAALAADHA